MPSCEQTQVEFINQFPMLSKPNSHGLLALFNAYTFTTATQGLLACLSLHQLHQLLHAIEFHAKFRQLAHLIRSRLLVLISEQFDRGLYFTHYDQIPKLQIVAQRSNLVAGHCCPQLLASTLEMHGKLVEKGERLMGEEFQQVREALFEPELALPPSRRATMAPLSQTVFQVTLACQGMEDQPDQLASPSQSCSSFFLQILVFQASVVAVYLQAIPNAYEHFAELTLRFMVYRNTVLALHSIAPFPHLHLPMQIWNNCMRQHYQQAHQVYAQLAGFTNMEEEIDCAGLSSGDLRSEGYLVDYVEGLVDQSIDQRSAAFVGHSLLTITGEYARLHALLVNSFTHLQSQNRINTSPTDLVDEWRQCGLKTVTIRQLCVLLSASRELIDDCCRQDDHIENCARIHGVTPPDRPRLPLACS